MPPADRGSITKMIYYQGGSHMADKLTCIDCGKTGADVQPTTTPDRRDFKTFDRCPQCFDKRLKSARQTMNRYPESFMGRCPLDYPEW